MVKVKAATLLILVALLLCSSTLTNAIRHDPAISYDSLANTEQLKEGVEEAEHETESCEGLGEEECLMRRTLAAHIDYIYTQKHKP